jgi:hypothetical protein
MGYKDKYKNMDRSNLTFLNADGSVNHNAVLAQIQKDLDAELAKISYTDPQGQAKRDAIFAQAEAKIKAENKRYDLEKLFGKVGSVLTTTQTGLSTLGINPPAQDKSAPIGGKDNYQPTQGKNYTWWIVGGVVALGVVGFFIYKGKK